MGTDIAHLGRQLVEVTLLLARLCLIFILSSFIEADHLVPYRRAEISVSNANDHALSEALSFLIPLLEHLRGEAVLH